MGIALALRSLGGVLADVVSLFNPNLGAHLSVYNAGVSFAISLVFTLLIYVQVINAVTTYLLGCNVSASTTEHCQFTAPITMIEGPNAFRAELITWLRSDKIQ